MKTLLIVFLALQLYGGTVFNPSEIRDEGLSVETICKNGLLIDVVMGKIKSINIRVEQAHCVDHSSWDIRSCTHQPIKCVKDKK